MGGTLQDFLFLPSSHLTDTYLQPFNDFYVWDNTTDNLIIYNSTASELNSYIGGDTQQASSVVTETNQLCYELSKAPCYSTYAFEVSFSSSSPVCELGLIIYMQYKPGMYDLQKNRYYKLARGY